jgi:hypothetical protein
MWGRHYIVRQSPNVESSGLSPSEQQSMKNSNLNKIRETRPYRNCQYPADPERKELHIEIADPRFQIESPMFRASTRVGLTIFHKYIA